MKQIKKRKELMIALSCIVVVAIAVSIIFPIISTAFAGKSGGTKAGTTSTGTTVGTDSSNTSQQSDKGNELNKYYTQGRAGSIDIGVIFLTPSSGDKNSLSFEIELGNHTIDLSKYNNLNKLAELDVDGVVISDGFTWTSEEGSGHHIVGVLKVSNSYKGQPVLKSDTKELKLILKNIEGAKETEFVYKGDTLK